MSQKDIFSAWKSCEAAAEAMVPLAGSLYRDHNIEISVFGRLIIKRSVTDILKAHRFALQVASQEISVSETYLILQAVQALGVKNAHLDLGKLVVKYRNQADAQSLENFLKEELAEAIGGADREATDVVLYGFGRIGRLLARLLVERVGGGNSLRLRAIVVRKGGANDLEKRANLLRRDSVHGSFKGTVEVDESAQVIIANGNFIQVIYADAPEKIDYREYDINNALIIDNTGKWRDAEGLSLHAQAKGADKVLLTAPGKGVKNIVMGVNDSDISAEDKLFSAASCTTNAIAPVLKVLSDKYGIDNGHMETVHSYTNDQNLIDNYHKGDRRGRAAGLNMVLTQTGAAQAVSKALPELEGKLTGNAIRVPTPNVSMAILNLNLQAEVSKDSLNDVLREEAMHGAMQKQIGYSNSPEAVSTDFVGSRSAGVVDALATIAEGKRCVLYVWYDNEFSYSCQVVRMLQKVAGCTLTAYPKISQ